MNMSYCRFENTLQDLQDCKNALREAGSWEALMAEASEYEKAAMLGMGKACEEMAEMFRQLGPCEEMGAGLDM
jgi:glycerate-2-kinase